MIHVLETENFKLSIEPKIFQEDIEFPANTILNIVVESDGFYANTTMDINIKYLAKFGYDLCRIYETLHGEARLEEPYGHHMWFSFVGNGIGHIAIKGYLSKGNIIGMEQVLEFENEIDQTYLKQFCNELIRNYKMYL